MRSPPFSAPNSAVLLIASAVLAVVQALRDQPASEQVSEAGSVRRLKEQVRDLDIIATADDPAAYRNVAKGAAYRQKAMPDLPSTARRSVHAFGCGFGRTCRVILPRTGSRGTWSRSS